MVMAVFLVQNRYRALERKLSLLLVAELTVCVFCWVSMIAYTICPGLYIRIESLFHLCIFYAQVTTFHFLFTLTGTGKPEKFKLLHYIVPLVIAATLQIWSLFVPEQIKLYITESRGAFPEGYEAYAFLAMSNRWMFMIYNIFYSVLGLRRIVKFKRVLEDYSADEGNSSVRWLRLLMYVTLATVPLSVIPALLGVNLFVTSAVTLIPTALIVLKDVLLTYNTVVSNYVVIETSVNEAPVAAVPSAENNNSGKPEKKRFEAYIRTNKPYLNPTLRITDMAADLNTNRTYLSTFINQEYGMNFSRYINRCRLTELEKLRVNPACATLSGMELAQKAGFSNFQGYIRTKRLEDKETTLKEENIFNNLLKQQKDFSNQ